MGMITKEKAVEVLNDLIDSDIFKEETEDALHDISICIDKLEEGLDLFGAEDDYVELFAAKADPYHSSAPYNTDELKREYDAWLDKVQAIAEKYRIKTEPIELTGE